MLVTAAARIQSQQFDANGNIGKIVPDLFSV